MVGPNTAISWPIRTQIWKLMEYKHLVHRKYLRRRRPRAHNCSMCNKSGMPRYFYFSSRIQSYRFWQHSLRVFRLLGTDFWMDRDRVGVGFWIVFTAGSWNLCAHRNSSAIHEERKKQEFLLRNCYVFAFYYCECHIFWVVGLYRFWAISMAYSNSLRIDMALLLILCHF